MKHYIFAFVSVLILFYLAGSFAFASFNIKEWDEYFRGLIAFLAIGFSCLSLGIVDDIKKQN